VLLGALAGVLAATVIVVATVALGWVDVRTATVPLTAVAFEIGVGAVCGGLAAPRALAYARSGRTFASM
jgi:hypothetical protein